MTIKYFDVSHYQGVYNPVGPTAAKATEGATYFDPQYLANKSKTIAKGFPFWAYHYLRNGGVAAQAAFAYSHIGNTPMMVDFEANGGFLPNCVEFVDSYRALGGVCNVVYLPRWYWQQIGQPDLSPLKNRGISLISSNYTAYSDSGPGWTPYGGMTPSIWQFTSTPLDTNAFKGSLSELEALWNGKSDMNAGDKLPIDPNIWNGSTQATVGVLLADAATYGLVTRNNVQEVENKVDALTSSVKAILTVLSNQASVAQIAAAVVAALPPASQGGLTKADVEAAVTEVLSKLTLKAI